MNDEPRYRFIPAWVALILILSCGQTVLAQGTAFTYQGKLTDAGNPANGNYDMQFRLFDDVSGGSQQGDTITNSSVAVSDGITRGCSNPGRVVTFFESQKRGL